MENASKALIIAGAILLSILIIAVGMYIYTSSSATVMESTTDMSTSEKESFNSTLTLYAGSQSGAQVQAMLKKLSANAKTFEEDLRKIPSVSVCCGNNGTNKRQLLRPTEENHPDDYIRTINEISNDIKFKHTYWVRVDVGASGLVNRIYVDYEKDTNEADGLNDPDSTMVR